MPSAACFGIGGMAPRVLAEAKTAGKPVPMNHSPFLTPVPEPTIRTGVEAMTTEEIASRLCAGQARRHTRTE